MAGTALTGKLEYVKKAIEAIKIDAAILINDSGFSYACEFCIGGSDAATTDSAFTVSMITRSGDVILNMQEWFATTSQRRGFFIVLQVLS